MDFTLLVNISARAWGLTILSLLHQGVPARQSRLLAASGAGRTAFRQSLDHLIQIGVLERNPGHGHPLRAEFRLTETGTIAAALAAHLLAGTSDEEQTLLRRTWTVPVLTVMREPCYFTDIRQAVSPITDRALSQVLKAMEDQDWVERSVDGDARPPRPVYTTVNRGSQISRMTARVLAGESAGGD